MIKTLLTRNYLYLLILVLLISNIFFASKSALCCAQKTINEYTGAGVGGLANNFIPSQVYILGDSLTVGFGSSGSNTVDKLSSMLGPTWEIRNRGVGRNTTAQMFARLDRDILAPHNARYVIVWGGTNDVYQNVPPGETESNLQAIYTALHNEGIKVVSVNIPPSKLSPTWTQKKQDIIDEVNAWIANSSQNIDFKVDIYKALENPDAEDSLLPIYHGGDFLHLNELGYFFVGESIYKAVNWLP